MLSNLNVKKRLDDQYYCQYSGFSTLSYVRDPPDSSQSIYIQRILSIQRREL